MGTLRVDMVEEIFDEFDRRLEELHWKETDGGVLLVGNDRQSPERIAAFALTANGLSAEFTELSDQEWRQAATISRPEWATETNPQYD